MNKIKCKRITYFTIMSIIVFIIHYIRLIYEYARDGYLLVKQHKIKKTVIDSLSIDEEYGMSSNHCR
jgi:hypothetical protein